MACSEPGIQQALNSCSFVLFSRASCSGLGNQATGEKAEATGKALFWDRWLQFTTSDANSLPPQAPAPVVCPHLERQHQAKVRTYHLPTHTFIVHANRIRASAPHHTGPRLTALNQTQSLPSSYLLSLGKTGE